MAARLCEPRAMQCQRRSRDGEARRGVRGASAAAVGDSPNPSTKPVAPLRRPRLDASAPDTSATSDVAPDPGLHLLQRSRPGPLECWAFRAQISAMALTAAGRVGLGSPRFVALAQQLAMAAGLALSPIGGLNESGATREASSTAWRWWWLPEP